MVMLEALSASEALTWAGSELDIEDGTNGLDGRVLLGQMIRRIVSTSGPIATRELARRVRTASAGLLPIGSDSSRVADTIDELAGNGDLVVRRSVDSNEVCYLAPPSFVRRNSGTLFISGGVTDGLLPLGQDLLSRIDHVGLWRTLRPYPGEDLESRLMDFGLAEVPMRLWLSSPPPTQADAVVAELTSDLAPDGPPWPVIDLEVLTTTGSSNRRRWKSPEGLSGIFIARREVAWGARRWCAVRLEDGHVISLIDMPHRRGAWRGCDEAWYLQAALDAARGHPSYLHVLERENLIELAIDIPIPQWIEHRLLKVGERIDPRGRQLLAFAVAVEEATEETTFLQEQLWLEVRREE